MASNAITPLKQPAEIPPSRTASVPVAIYTRVSTTGQVGGRFDSCESQAAICRDYIARNAEAGWHEIACYTDAAYSGSTMNRPGITALKRQIAAGEVKVVLIFKLERMLRSTDEWAPFRSFLQQHGCKLVSTTEDLTEDTPSGRLKNNIMVSVAEYERLNTAEKVRAKMLEQAKRGYWNYGLVPYGYRYDEKQQQLQPDLAEAQVVRLIFEDAARLVPLNVLVEKLVAAGHKTRVRTWKSRDGQERTVGGGFFRTDLLRAMLRNPLYAGRIRFLGKDYPAKHEALVSAEVWEKANAGLASPKRLVRDPFRSSNVHGFFLKGLVRCGHCQRALMPWASSLRGREKKQFRYYVCDAHSHARGEQHCPIRAVPAHVLESAVVAYVGGIARHPALLHRAVEQSRVRSQRERTPLQQRLTELDREIVVVSRQIKHCVDAVANGGTDAIADELRERARSLKDRKHEMLVQREQARQDLTACEQELVGDDRIRLALGRFGEVFPELTKAEQARLMQLCVDQITVSARTGKKLGVREMELAIRLPVARLVEGMEEQLVVECRGARLRNMERRTLTLPVSIGTERSGAVSILRPFGLPLAPGKPEVPRAEPRVYRHALHRALAWQRLRAKQPQLTTAQFAGQVGASPATVDYHAGLLRLLYAGQSDKREDEGSVLARIRDGEDERVEFKPFGRLESAKAEELVRTVIAFANKRGGTIYLGVNDHQEIEGVEKDLRESAPSEKRGSILECAAWYCAAIRKRIADRVSSAVVLECDSIRVCGKLLIHLTVLESKSKPCCDVSTKEIWTRRVANTVRPDPSGDELRQLIGGASQMMKIF